MDEYSMANNDKISEWEQFLSSINIDAAAHQLPLWLNTLKLFTDFNSECN